MSNPQAHGQAPNKTTRPYSCPECQSAFTRVAHLRRHQNTHRGDRPFVCAYCSVSSSRKDVIVRHSKKFHPGNVVRRGKEKRVVRMLKNSDIERRREPSDEIQPLPTSTSPPAQGSSRRSRIETCPDEETINQTSISEPHFDDLAFLMDSLPSLTSLSPMDYQMLESFQMQKQDLTPPHSRHSTRLSTRRRPFEEGMSHNVLPENLPNIDCFLLGQDGQRKDQSHVPMDDDLARAQAKLSLLVRHEGFPISPFPSKYRVLRFVKAFFEHMAPFMPIVHEPSFKIATVAAPLLIQIMACGALYSSEKDIAAKLHAVALQLILEDQRLALSGAKDGRFELWVLQTCLLISVFRAFTTTAPLERQEVNVFPYTIQLAHQALNEVKTTRPTTYGDWVHEESVSRCIAGTYYIGVALKIATREQSFALPISDATFPLPSDTTTWNTKEADWPGSAQMAPACSLALKSVLAGQMPTSNLSEFGLLTIAAVILSRICFFEALYATQQPDVFMTFSSGMEQSLQILDDLLEAQTSIATRPGTLYEPLSHCTYTVLNSAYYHLHCSQPLTSMKKLLRSPETLESLGCLFEVSDDLSPMRLQKGLVRATEAWRDDSRLGVRYLQRVGPHKFSPLAVPSILEGSLLSCWYMLMKPLNQLPVEEYLTLETVTAEAVSELNSSDSFSLDEVTTLPLTTYAKLLSENSVWYWPSAMATVMIRLKDQLGLLSSTARPDIYM